MKRKVMLALIATLTLTVGSLGVVSAHEHSWGDAYYVVDQEATEDTKEWVVDKEGWVEEITEIQTICYNCESKGIHTQFVNDKVVGTGESLVDHVKNHMRNGESGQYGSREVVIDTIEHPEEGHWETIPGLPELGHWEHECSECGEIENCEEPGDIPEEPTDPSDPTDPSEPTDPTDPTDPSDPTDPTDPTDPSEPTNPGEATDTPDNTQDQQTDQTTNEKADDATEETAENKAPRTGDPASLIYLATLGGSAVAGGTAFKMRKKFKK